MRNLLSLFLLVSLLSLVLAGCTTSREGCPMNSAPKAKFRR
ncbi:MAG: hypothetical protein ACKOA3_01945 [Sphingomonadales bacterium]